MKKIIEKSFSEQTFEFHIPRSTFHSSELNLDEIFNCHNREWGPLQNSFRVDIFDPSPSP